MLKKRDRSGFTLVELSVVLIIISFVTTVSLNTYFEQILKSKAAEAYVYLRSIHDAQFVFANETVFTRANFNQCIPQSRFSRIASSVCDSDTYCNEIVAKPPSRKKQYVYIYSTYNDNLFSTENCSQSNEFAQVGSWEALGLSSVDRSQEAVAKINALPTPSLLMALNENFGIATAHASLLDNLIGGDSDDSVSGDANADVNDSIGDLGEQVDNLLGGNNTSDNDGSEIDALVDATLGDNNLGIDVDIDLDGEGDSLIEGSAEGETTENENGGQDTLLDIDLTLNMPGNGDEPNSDLDSENGDEDNNETPINDDEITLVGDKINIIRLPTALNFSFYAAHNQQIMQEYGLDDIAKTITIFAIADVDGDYTGGNISFPEQYESKGVNPILSDNVWVISRSLYVDDQGDIQVVGGIYQANPGE